MKALFYDRKQSIRVGTCIPTKPGPGEVQIRVSHCGICGTDLHIFQGHMDQRVASPHIPGHEMSGTIVAVGPGVERWREGDRVTVRPLDACGHCPACKAGHQHICMNLKFLGIDSPGAMQHQWTVPANTLHRLPDDVSFKQGALIEPLAVAAHDVRLGDVKQNEYVVVQGGGPIGLLIALVAKQQGACVLITEINPFRVDFARKLGIDAVNPRDVDVVEYVTQQTNGAGADVVFEVSGSNAGAALMTKLPRTRGRIVTVAIFPNAPQVDLFQFFWRELKLCGARVYEPQDFEKAIDLTQSEAIPLDRIISNVLSIDDLTSDTLTQSTDTMKTLIRCSI